MPPPPPAWPTAPAFSVSRPSHPPEPLSAAVTGLLRVFVYCCIDEIGGIAPRLKYPLVSIRPRSLELTTKRNGWFVIVPAKPLVPLDCSRVVHAPLELVSKNAAWSLVVWMRTPLWPPLPKI